MNTIYSECVDANINTNKLYYFLPVRAFLRSFVTKIILT